MKIRKWGDIIKRQIDEIILEQEAIISRLKIISELDTAKENALLREDIKRLEGMYGEQLQKLSALEDENKRHREKLSQIAFDDRADVFSKAKSRLDNYAVQTKAIERQSIFQYETVMRNKISHLKQLAEKYRLNSQDEVIQKLNNIESELAKSAGMMRGKIDRSIDKRLEEHNEEFSYAKTAPLSNEEIAKATKSNGFEKFIGLNVVNKIGILLIVLAVIVAARFGFLNMSDMIRSAIIFVLGGVLLLGGELINHKNANVFSLGLSAGGVAVLYTGVAVTYFIFGIFSPYTALLATIIITAISYFLSIRYDAQVILAFTLIGGYLPVTAMSLLDVSLIAPLMLYLIILSLSVLFMSIKKRWLVCSYIGVILNIPVVSLVIYAVPYGFNILGVSAIIYAMFSFGIYTVVPIISAYKKGEALTINEIPLMAINSFFSTIVLITAFYRFDLSDFVGLFVAVFAGLYFVLGYYINTQIQKGEKSSILFNITGYTFLALVVPFQFDIQWLSLGWLIEGVLLAVYGTYSKNKLMKNSGLIIYVLCFASFIFVDGLVGNVDHTDWKYFAVTLGAAIITIALIKLSTINKAETVFAYATLVNAWFYSLYLFMEVMVLPRTIPLNRTYIAYTIFLVTSAIYAYLLSRKQVPQLPKTRYLSYVIYGLLSVVSLLVNNMRIFYLGFDVQFEAGYVLFGSVVVATMIVTAIFMVFDLSRLLSKRQGSWIYLIPSVYFVFVLTQGLTVQMDISFSSYIISISYMIIALVWIVLGFAKRIGSVRRFGLLLSMLSLMKIFVVDNNLIFSDDTFSRIVSYFTLGVILIIISFVYQYFSKRMEAQEMQEEKEQIEATQKEISGNAQISVSESSNSIEKE